MGLSLFCHSYTQNNNFNTIRSNMEERSPSLSREEQEELIRSNKKVKDVNHAGYHEGRDSFPSSPSHGYSPWNRATSFKDKLIGEIPGAFT